MVNTSNLGPEMAIELLSKPKQLIAILKMNELPESHPPPCPGSSHQGNPPGPKSKCIGL